MNASLDPAGADRARLLIVDDEAPLLRALCDTLELEGYAAVGCASATAAIEALRGGRFELLVTDLMMPEMDGISLLRAAHEIDADLAGLIMTGHATIDTAVEAMKAGAYDYLVKPFRLSHVLPVISRALEARRLRRANRELERRILARTRELEIANRELEIANRDLESFSYSVSHDLRAPLRAVRGYCDALIEDHGGDIPAEGRELLDRVAAGAARMARLIDDLLSFSRLGRERLTFRRVSMKELVEAVSGELRRQHPDRSVEMVLGELPDCQGDTALLKQVLVNLLSNAWKFTAGRNQARIEVGGAASGERIVYFVKDNGAGFDMKYAGKLFGVFQRLHSQSEFEGTGVGLSIVQRIVERHGGTVWAEGRPGEGATFHFALPTVAADARAVVP
jgi:signal transduction histidine kinase